MEDKVFKIEKVIHRVDKYEVYAICKFTLASTLFSVNKKKLDTHVSNVTINSRMMILLILG